MAKLYEYEEESSAFETVKVCVLTKLYSLRNVLNIDELAWLWAIASPNYFRASWIRAASLSLESMD